MKSTTQTRSTQTPSSRSNWKRGLIRSGALTALIALGAATALLAQTSAAGASATNSAYDPHESFMAAMHGGHSHEDVHAHFDKVLTQAGVAEAQKQQIHAIMKEAMTAEHADMESFHASLKQMQSLLTAETIDEAAIARVRAEQDRFMIATSHRMSDTMVAAAKVLTPEQRAKLGREIDQMMAGHDMHHHSG